MAMLPVQKAQFIAQCKMYKEINEQLIRQLKEEQETLNDQQRTVPCDCNHCQQVPALQFLQNYVWQPVPIPQNNTSTPEVPFALIPVFPVGFNTAPVPGYIPTNEATAEVAPEYSTGQVEFLDPQYDSDGIESIDSDRLVIDTDSDTAEIGHLC